jgi:N-acetylmuramoyl-L-alanine amidase
MKILIDPGHGLNTPGKRSPDGRFLEAQFNREISRNIVCELRDRGYDAELLVTEDTDIPLKQRVSRANAHSTLHGKDQVIIISIHANAFGNGKEWTSPKGWSIYTSKGKTESDKLATCIAQAAQKYLPNLHLRGDFSDHDIDYEESFYILNKTISPAVLTENGFFTNKEDLAYIESRQGKRAITDLHVEGIIEYLMTKRQPQKQVPHSLDSK